MQLHTSYPTAHHTVYKLHEEVLLKGTDKHEEKAGMYVTAKHKHVDNAHTHTHTNTHAHTCTPTHPHTHSESTGRPVPLVLDNMNVPIWKHLVHWS